MKTVAAPDLLATASVASAGDDIQAMVAAGFNTLPLGEYLLLTVNDAAGARGWLRQVLKAHLVLPVNGVRRELDQRATEVATIAMSHAGLIAAEVPHSGTRPFPSTFSRGMTHPLHARLLGDDGVSDWRWGDTAPAGSGWHVAHWLVAHYWLGLDDRAGGARPHPLFGNAALAAAGFRVRRVMADPNFVRPDGRALEPFGFRDGIAQPVIRGLRNGRTSRHREIDDAAKPDSADRLVAAGEFVLGYPNEYNQRSYAPDVEGWSGDPQGFGFNGSYVAVRQIVQDVAAFHAFERDHPMTGKGPGGALPPTVGELMVGRLRDGTPLSACPVVHDDMDTFRYRMDDLQGFGCPRGAHVRRANPRDTLANDIAAGVDASKLHRLLRRGRSYIAESPNVDGSADPERGMFFMALNADLDRQFVFVQRQWIASSTFGDLCDQEDPLLGSSHRSFTVQRQDLSVHLTGIPRFTTVVGGGYFLLPSVRALNFVADLPRRCRANSGSATLPAPRQEPEQH